MKVAQRLRRCGLNVSDEAKIVAFSLYSRRHLFALAMHRLRLWTWPHATWRTSICLLAGVKSLPGPSNECVQAIGVRGV